jgi:hypothetical protein
VDHPGTRPGWARAVERYVEVYRDPIRSDHRRVKCAGIPVALYARRAVYVAPSGARYAAAKVDAAHDAMPRGENVAVVIDEVTEGPARGLHFLWTSPTRNGRLVLAPLLGGTP